MWCVAHKGEVNSRDPAGTGRTPLHAACEADQRRAVAVLLLNGASMYVDFSQSFLFLRVDCDGSICDEVLFERNVVCRVVCVMYMIL